jgi:DNA polymerase-1
MDDSFSNSSDTPVYLVDGSGYIFRAFYAVAPLTTKSGFPTNALFGFSRMLLKLLNEAKSSHIVVCFDAGKKTFRNDLYAEYKANRATPPDELIAQFPYFREITESIGFVTLEQEGFEADDLIGTLAKQLSEAGHSVTIVSGDKDLMQLVNDKVTIWDTMRDKIYTSAEVKEKMGVLPEKIIDLLTLVGDSSDNVPGLKGVGPKTAAQLIEFYEDIETILAASGKIREDARIRGRVKIADSLECDAEKVRLSRKLVTIDTKVPLVLNSSDNTSKTTRSGTLLKLLETGEPNREKLKALTERFEFSSLFDRLLLKFALTKEDSTYDYQTIFADDFPAWLEKFKAQNDFALDCETTSLDPLTAEVVGVSVCWDANQAFYIPMAHEEENAEGKKQISWNDFVTQCKAHLESPAVRIAGQNIKYDFKVFQQNGITMRGLSFDTMVAAYLLNSEQRSYTLDTLADQYLNRTLISYKTVTEGLTNFSQVSIRNATRYAAEDAHVAWLLKELFLPLLSQGKLEQLFFEVEMPLVAVIADMELAGVGLDVQFLKEMSLSLSTTITNLEQEIYKLAKGEFNINSPKQLSEVLFERLGLATKGLKKTKSGTSTDSSVLDKLQHVHPIVDYILKYRMLHKLRSTYVDALPLEVSPVTGRIHSSFHQTGTATGRLSSSDPNLQNIPIQTEEGRKIRRAFISKPGFKLISADYSQVELRVLAHMSLDENLLQAFKDGVDIHAKTARELLNIPAGQEVTPEQRRIGKTLNFGVVYGMSGFRLASELGLPVSVAQSYIDAYFARYPKVGGYFKKLEEEAVTSGEVRTLLGRKRKISDLDATGRDKGFMLRAAINAPLQGTSADIIKVAMVKLGKIFKQNNYPISLIMQVHDELVFECSEQFIERAQALIKETMENAVPLALPLAVDIVVGETWEKVH